MLFKDIAYLQTRTKTVDDEGISTEVYVDREVFVNVGKVRQSEFYQAAATGLKPTLMLEVFQYDYNEEDRLKFNDVVYKVIRTYPIKNEKLEIVCERL